jgi:Dyp-type peroxidase family
MEPVLDADDIQADIAPGFRLPFQHIVGLRATLAQARAIVSELRPRLTVMREAARYHRRRLELAREMHTFGVESFSLTADAPLEWINVAFGAPVLAAAGLGAPARADRSFEQGLAARSTTIGDPQDPADPAHRSHWMIGGPDNVADLLVVLGSDSSTTLDDLTRQLAKDWTRLGATIIHGQLGERLPGDKEHFGFRDGVSQPAMRGRLTDAADDFLTRRKFPPAPPGVGAELAAPGEVLVWPGEFLFGYPRQDSHDFREPLAEEPIDPTLRNGSFLVYRRLAQDVAAFRAATAQMTETLQASAPFAGVEQGWVEARLVGRWPSGAPLVQHPLTDPGEPPGTLDRYNHFAFNERSAAVTLPSGEQIGEFPGDPEGVLCPRHAHIRKVNPRDLGTNLGPASHTQRLRLLRRGIPFGTHFNPDAPDDEPRGLLFISFQRSIRNQFEPLARDWMNSDTNPESPEGHDMIVGQTRTLERFCMFQSGPDQVRVSSNQRWITPTGGGYFFCPSLSTIDLFLARHT